MNLNKVNIFVSTLNFIFVFVGYQFITTVFLPASSEIDIATRTVTIPYRGFVLFMCLFLIIFNFRVKNSYFSLPLKIFLAFWFFLIIRIFYDTNLRSDVHLIDTFQLWMYIIGICIPLIFAMIKTYNYIDLNFSLYTIFIILGIILFITLFSNQALFLGDIDEGRKDANVALNTISFGHLGVTTILIGLFILLNKKLSKFYNILVVIVVVLGFYSMLRSGSRGPFMALSVVILFWFLSSGKYFFKGVIIVLLLLIFTIIFINPILEFIGYISPLMEERLKMSIYEGDTSERNPLYEAAFNHFLNNPLFGNRFALFESVGYYEGNGTFIYSHNIILDAFMGLGIFGGIAIIFFLINALKISYFNIKNNNSNYWISLVLIQQISFDMVSNSFYYDSLLSVLLVFHFLYFNTKINGDIVDIDT